MQPRLAMARGQLQGIFSAPNTISSCCHRQVPSRHSQDKASSWMVLCSFGHGPFQLGCRTVWAYNVLLRLSLAAHNRCRGGCWRAGSLRC